MGAPLIKAKTFDYREPTNQLFDTAQVISLFYFVSLTDQQY